MKVMLLHAEYIICSQSWGQLTVHMCLNEIAVPSIYGPSTDDRGF